MAINPKKLQKLRSEEIKTLKKLKSIWVEEQIAFKGYFNKYVDQTPAEWIEQVDARLRVLEKYTEVENDG